MKLLITPLVNHFVYFVFTSICLIMQRLHLWWRRFKALSTECTECLLQQLSGVLIAGGVFLWIFLVWFVGVFFLADRVFVPYQTTVYGAGFSVLEMVMRLFCCNSCYSPRICLASYLLLTSFTDVCTKFSIMLNYHIAAFCSFPFVCVLVDVSVHFQSFASDIKETDCFSGTHLS